MRKKTMTYHLPLRVTEETRLKLEQRAAREGMTKSQMARKIICASLQKEKIK